MNYIPTRLKKFPASVPMNIREAVLVAADALNRIREEKASQKTAHAETEQEENLQEPAPAPAEVIVPPPKQHRIPLRTQIIFPKS